MDTDGKPPKLSYTVPEFQEATGLGRNSVYEEVKRGRLRITKVGRRSIIRAEDARAWLASLGPAAGSP